MLCNTHAEFNNMSFDVNPAKELIRSKVNTLFPMDKFDVLKMKQLGDGLMFLPENTDYWYVVDKNGVGHRVQTEAEAVGFAPGTTCDLLLDIMGMGMYPADIQGF